MFTVEVRDKNEEKIHRTMDEIRDAIVSIAKQRGVRCETRRLGLLCSGKNGQRE